MAVKITAIAVEVETYNNQDNFEKEYSLMITLPNLAMA